MKKNLLFQILICLLILCSAFYIRYRKATESTAPCFAQGTSAYTNGLTFSDFAGTLPGVNPRENNANGGAHDASREVTP